MLTKPEIVIWGASQHALVVAEVIRLAGDFSVAGFLDDVRPGRVGESFGGGEVLGGREMLAPLRERGVDHMAFGFGLYEPKPALVAGPAAGFAFPTLIHPAANVPSGTAIGPGTVIKAGAVIDPGAEIGAHVIVGAGTVVTHGSVLGDGARLAAGAVLGSRVRVGSGALIGLNATVRGGVHIGARSLVGAGSVALADVPPGMAAAGNPARVFREVRPDDF